MGLTRTEMDDIKHEFRVDFDSHDPWGSVMGWFFDVAETLYARDAYIPEEWQFRPGRGESEESERLEDYSSDTLLQFGNVLNRYAAALESAGRSY